MTRSSRAGGFLLGLVLVGLPGAAPWLWPALARSAHPTVARGVAACAVGAWVWFVVALVSEVRRQRAGQQRRSNAIGWLAAAMTATVVLAVPPAMVAHHHGPQVTHVMPSTLGGGSLPLALAAKKRRDALLHERRAIDEADIERLFHELEGRNDAMIADLASRIPAAVDGIVAIDLRRTPEVRAPGPVVVLALESHDDVWTFAFARPGGTLPLAGSTHWRDHLVALHDGPLVVTTSALETLRALATRRDPMTVVVHASAEALDPDLAAVCVRVESTRVEGATTVGDDAIRVRLLQPDPELEGAEEIPPRELLRRVIEIVAYLALHRHEPVSGDRLRTRVLGRGRTDASTRALANVISAARRCLGRDAHGPRLHAVVPGEPYRTHGIGSDVGDFFALVSDARDADPARQRALLLDALMLVRGEPLVASARTWDWFLAEGWLARLARDGEWAALTLSRIASVEGDLAVAWWALEQGRALDPYSDALLGAQARLPRQANFDAMDPADCSTSPSAPAVE